MKNPIFDIENWQEIGATPARNKTRTFLTAFGIFWGTAMLAMLWGGARGFEGIMRRQFAGFATNTGAVFSGQRSISYKGFNKGSTWNLNEFDCEAIRLQAPAIEYSSEVNGGMVTAAYGSRTKSGQAIGIESDYNKIMTPVVLEGRLINDADVSNARKTAVIGKNISSELFRGESPIGKQISLNGVYFTVVGVAEQMGEASIMGKIDDSFIIPNSTHRRMFSNGSQVGMFLYTAPDGRKPSDNEAVIRRILSSTHYIDPSDERAIGFMDVSEMFSMINGMFVGITLLALFVGAGSLMAGVIGVGNIMWIIVRERTQEFGIRRALGAKPLDITVQVLSESVVLTLVAGTAGVCFAALVLGIADYATVDPNLGHAGFELPFSTAVAILGMFVALGTAAGTLPALKAMKIKPIEAMRDK